MSTDKLREILVYLRAIRSGSSAISDRASYFVVTLENSPEPKDIKEALKYVKKVQQYIDGLTNFRNKILNIFNAEPTNSPEFQKITDIFNDLKALDAKAIAGVDYEHGVAVAKDILRTSAELRNELENNLEKKEWTFTIEV